MKILKENEVKEKTFELYKCPDLTKIEKLGIQMHWLSYYKKWIPQENYYYAAKKTGFRPNPEGRSEGTYSKYASLDDKTDGFHFYMSYIKFGLGRATSDAAHEIRDGHLSRNEGASLVRRYDGEFPQKHFKEFLEYLGIAENKFWQIVNSYRPKHIWGQKNGKWYLKHQIQ